MPCHVSQHKIHKKNEHEYDIYQRTPRGGVTRTLGIEPFVNHFYSIGLQNISVITMSITLIFLTTEKPIRISIKYLIAP